MSEVLAIESGALQRIADVLGAQLGDAVLDTEVFGPQLWVRVERSAWHRAVEVCKRQLGLSWFGFLSGLDWQPAPGLSGEKAFKGEEVTDEDAEDDAVEEEVVAELKAGRAGGTGRFQVMCRLEDVRRHVGVTLKVDLDEADPRLDSIVDLYRGADWHERETWEMFGFTFDGHPGLRHLYLPNQFEGFPLRKDFPLLAREIKPWPGIVNVEQIPAHLDPKNQQPPAEPAAAEPTAADAAPVPGAQVADADAANQARGVPTEDQATPTETAAEAEAAGQAGPDADAPASGASAGQVSAEVATPSQEAGDKTTEEQP